MAQTALPASDISAGSWTPSAGASLFGTIDEAVADDSDFIQSSLSPAMVDVSEVKLGAITDPAVSTGHVVNYRYAKSAAGGDRINLNVRLVQGTTIIASWFHTDISDTLTTASQTLTGAQADSITNYADLRLRFELYEAPDAPIAPATANYSIPAGATSVTTQAQLETAIAGAATDIVLENGSYTRSGYLTVAGTKRLWARTYGAVTLNYGIMMGGNSGAGTGGIRGITFNVSGSAQCPPAGVVHLWGAGGINLTVTDCAFNMTSMPNGINGIVAYGGAAGLVAQRIIVNGATENGLRISDNNNQSTLVINTITDINVDGVKYSPPAGAGGTAEAGVWIGHQVTNPVTRIKVRNTGWMGVWTGNRCRSTTLSHLDIDRIGVDTNGGVGIYMEHSSHMITVTNFQIGPQVGVGADHEWDNDLEFSLASTHTFPTGTITVTETISKPATSGTLYVGNPDGTITTVTYTGFSGTSFTGVSGGSGSYPAGTIVSASSWQGGMSTYKVNYLNGIIDAAQGGGYGLFFDNGSMYPTVTNVAFVRAIGGVAIRDRTNNPQATSAGTSLLTFTGCYFAPGLTQRSFG